MREKGQAFREIALTSVTCDDLIGMRNALGEAADDILGKLRIV